MTALDVARTIARSEKAVLAYQDQPHLTIMRDLALGPRAALLVAELGTPVAVPGAPTSVVAAIVSTTKIHVTWVAPTTPDPLVDHYEVSTTPATSTISPDSSARATDFDAAFASGTAYTVHVKAVSLAGAGAAGDSGPVTPNP